MNSVQAEKAYSEALSREFGMEPLCRIDTKRIYGAIELRNAVGFGEFRPGAAEKYVDQSFYKEALATLDFEPPQFGPALDVGVMETVNGCLQLSGEESKDAAEISWNLHSFDHSIR